MVPDIDLSLESNCLIHLATAGLWLDYVHILVLLVAAFPSPGSVRYGFHFVRSVSDVVVFLFALTSACFHFW